MKNGVLTVEIPHRRLCAQSRVANRSATPGRQVVQALRVHDRPGRQTQLCKARLKLAFHLHSISPKHGGPKVT